MIKRRTWSYLITGITPNGKLLPPEHLTKSVSFNKEDMIFLSLMLITILYFGYGIISK